MSADLPSQLATCACGEIVGRVESRLMVAHAGAAE